MAAVSGHRLSLSVPRRLIGDLMHAARGTPIITFERRVDLSAVCAVRAQMAHPPSWALLLAKAFGAVAAKNPELRRAYLRFPWPHLWEANESVAAVAVEREYRGEPGVFFGFLRAPEKATLQELTTILTGWKTSPVENGFRLPAPDPLLTVPAAAPPLPLVVRNGLVRQEKNQEFRHVRNQPDRFERCYRPEPDRTARCLAQYRRTGG